MFGKKERRVKHADPMIESKLNYIRSLNEAADAARDDLQTLQEAMKKALRRRGMSGLDGIRPDAYDAIMNRCERELPRLRAEIVGYAEKAEKLTGEMDENDRAFL